VSEQRKFRRSGHCVYSWRQNSGICPTPIGRHISRLLSTVKRRLSPALHSRRLVCIRVFKTERWSIHFRRMVAARVICMGTQKPHRDRPVGATPRNSIAVDLRPRICYGRRELDR
jgi:hypothetical protein